MLYDGHDYRFYHRQIRDKLYNGLSDNERQAYHKEIAEILEET